MPHKFKEFIPSWLPIAFPLLSSQPDAQSGRPLCNQQVNFIPVSIFHGNFWHRKIDRVLFFWKRKAARLEMSNYVREKFLSPFIRNIYVNRSDGECRRPITEADRMADDIQSCCNQDKYSAYQDQ